MIELCKNDPCIEFKDYDYVCSQKNSEILIIGCNDLGTYKNLQQKWFANITVHGFQYMFVTILIEHVVPLPIIFGLLGHSFVHMTCEYYFVIMEEQDKIIDLVNNIFISDRTGTYIVYRKIRVEEFIIFRMKDYVCLDNRQQLYNL